MCVYSEYLTNLREQKEQQKLNRNKPDLLN